MASTTVSIGSDKIQARQKPTHREQQLGRRNLLGALVAAPAALSATPAIAVDQDPHIAWWRERERLVAELDALHDVGDDVRGPVLHAKWAVEDLVADTPATTLAGLRLQALAGLLHLEEDFPDTENPQIEIRALRSIVASLDQLIAKA